MNEEHGFISLKNWQLIGAEYRNAVEKHGPLFATPEEGIDALLEEVIELTEAVLKNDIDGPHGVRREAAQVAVVCCKILEGLRDGTNETGKY